MPYLVTLNIADFVVALRTDSSMATALRRRYGGFVVASAESPHLDITVETTQGRAFRPIVPHRAIALDIAYQQPRLTFTSHFEQGVVDFATGRGTATIVHGASLENFLRVIWAWLCVLDGGLILHASAVIRGGVGVVFCGMSGAGKSTVAALSQSAGIVLSEDIAVIRRHAHGYVLHAAPFRGDARGPAQAPLGALFLLRQATSHAIETVHSAEAVAQLAACAPFVNAVSDMNHAVLAVCQQMTATVPVARLNFRKDPAFWSVIDAYFIPDSPAA